jgi:hypothetical protein
MNKTIFFIGFWALSFYAAAGGLPPNVIKVTEKNNPKCIDYLTYKGEMYCSLTAMDSEPMDPQLLSYEKQTIQFDSRPWRAAWGKHGDSITSIEYIPVGDNINNWHELITSQFIPGFSDVSAKEWGKRFFESLEKTGIVYTTQVIENNGSVFLFEFRVQKPQNLRQDEIQKVVKGPDGIYVLHYAIKKEDMGAENRAKWIKNLKASALKN